MRDFVKKIVFGVFKGISIGFWLVGLFFMFFSWAFNTPEHEGEDFFTWLKKSVSK